MLTVVQIGPGFPCRSPTGQIRSTKVKGFHCHISAVVILHREIVVVLTRQESSTTETHSSHDNTKPAEVLKASLGIKCHKVPEVKIHASHDASVDHD